MGRIYNQIQYWSIIRQTPWQPIRLNIHCLQQIMAVSRPALFLFNPLLEYWPRSFDVIQLRVFSLWLHSPYMYLKPCGCAAIIGGRIIEHVELCFLKVFCGQETTACGWGVGAAGGDFCHCENDAENCHQGLRNTYGNANSFMVFFFSLKNHRGGE